MSKPVKAILLAAGFGTRLRPITNERPKCLVPVGHEPLLGRWLRQLERSGCEHVLINTHYLAGQVEEFIEDWERKSMKISIVHEPVLLGTAGTLVKNQDFFDGATGLLIHSDNAMEGDLKEFVGAHNRRESDCLMTMLTFNTRTPESCGIVVVDERDTVIEFHEKVEEPPGNQANGAIYAFDESLLAFLKGMTKQPTDFSTEVIPRLLGRIKAWHTEKNYIDIGNPQSLEEANRLFQDCKWDSQT